jgi:hypothetical protein
VSMQSQESIVRNAGDDVAAFVKVGDERHMRLASSERSRSDYRSHPLGAGPTVGAASGPRREHRHHIPRRPGPEGGSGSGPVRLGGCRLTGEQDCRHDGRSKEHVCSFRPRRHLVRGTRCFSSSDQLRTMWTDVTGVTGYGSSFAMMNR